MIKEIACATRILSSALGLELEQPPPIEVEVLPQTQLMGLYPSKPKRGIYDPRLRKAFVAADRPDFIPRLKAHEAAHAVMCHRPNIATLRTKGVICGNAKEERYARFVEGLCRQDKYPE